MNSSTLKSKRILIPTGLAVLALGIGGVAWAGTASAGDVRGEDRDQVANAAVEAAGGGEAIEVEKSDDGDEAYEVEVRQPDGDVVDVDLDEQLNVLRKDVDDDLDDGDRRDDDGRDDLRDDRDDVRDADDRALSVSERTRAERAALAEVGGGTVTDVEASDDRGEAYEVDVRGTDGRDWDVALDSRFTVVDKHLDD